MTEKKVLVDLDLNQNKIKNAVIDVDSTNAEEIAQNIALVQGGY